MERRWLSQKEAAEYMGVDVRTIKTWRFQRGLPSRKASEGSVVRIDKNELDEWVQNEWLPAS